MTFYFNKIILKIMKNIHVIPTDKPSRLFKNIHTKLLSIRKYNDKPLNEATQNKHIYITADEEIKHNKYCLINGVLCKTELLDSRIVSRQLTGGATMDICKSEYFEIILTTNPELIADRVQAIDDEFLEWFVKNPSCEFVEFESFCKNGDNCPSQGDYDKQHLCDVGYKIIIPKEEPKQETLEEVAFRKRKELGLKGTIEGFIAGFKACEEQNKNLYSEKDVLNLFKKYQNSFPLYRNIQVLDREFNEWFEQFKKKL